MIHQCHSTSQTLVNTTEVTTRILCTPRQQPHPQILTRTTHTLTKSWLLRQARLRLAVRILSLLMILRTQRVEYSPQQELKRSPYREVSLIIPARYSPRRAQL